MYTQIANEQNENEIESTLTTYYKYFLSLILLF